MIIRSELRNMFHPHLNHVVVKAWMLVTINTHLQIAFPKQLLLYMSDTTHDTIQQREYMWLYKISHLGYV